MLTDNYNSTLYSSKYLNSLKPTGLPPSVLKLKIGCPIILLRNLAPHQGLCNGSHLVITNLNNHVIEACILTGDYAGNLTFISCISLTSSTSELLFILRQCQFPIQLAFAMTINKLQGHSVKHIGLNLRTPIFSHGQLYVALSHCTSPQCIKILLPTNTNNTLNIVYPEVILNN
ncbi:8463_t:CDS:2 [Gigaspora margarita]|uniref:8463_t:CDS:1 n=1 Tax=Gigaspora margarita TaxID=4874 RepID=A0ABN7W662_GIGMA|nr:8463_t:CDS:2 [Gigaspora margarita]